MEPAAQKYRFEIEAGQVWVLSALGRSFHSLGSIWEDATFLWKVGCELLFM
jgi:hypothetical protein